MMRKLFATLLLVFWPGLLLKPMVAQRTVFFGQNATVSGGAITPPPSTNLQAWYKADSLSATPVTTWADSSASAANLTSVGSPTWSSSQVNGLPAVAFNGSQYFTLSGIPYTGTISIYMVVKPTSVSTTQSFTSSNLDNAFVFGITSAALQKADEQNTASLGNSTSTLSAGQWVEIAVTYDNTSSHFYKNGVADGGATVSSAISHGINLIGTNWASGPGVTETFNGQIAEILIYNSATFQSAVHTYLVARYGV
jgi:hypothetical protein